MVNGEPNGPGRTVKVCKLEELEEARTATGGRVA